MVVIPTQPAYRGSTVRPVCHVCGELAPGIHCRRCNAPLCQAHVPLPQKRCPACEEVFQLLEKWRRTELLRPWQLLSAYVLSCLVAGIAAHVIGTSGLLTSAIGLWLIIAAVALAAATPLAFIIIRRRRLRGTFLGEHPEGRRLKPPRDRPPLRAGPPWDGVSIASLTTSLIFFLPFVPFIGALLGACGIIRTRKRQGRGLAVAGIVVGLLLGLGQIGLFVYFVSSL